MSAEHGQEPIHDPSDLLDELDSIIRAQEMLRHRTTALQARYAALESFAEQFDNLGGVGRAEFGHINVEFTAKNLDEAAARQDYAKDWLSHARELAVKVREYPQPRRSTESPEADRRRSR